MTLLNVSFCFLFWKYPRHRYSERSHGAGSGLHVCLKQPQLWVWCENSPPLQRFQCLRHGNMQDNHETRVCSPNIHGTPVALESEADWLREMARVSAVVSSCG